MDFSERIMRRIPDGLSISKRTTPVVYFGAYSTAKSCTISINPSDREFYSKSGILLTGDEARLCSREFLGKADSEVLDNNDFSKVLDYCENYFGKNPYRAWFDKYEELLKVFSLSYYNGSAVHLDLVQWATTPFWNKLDDSTREKLLKQDLPFLSKLLEKNFEYIFLNGKTVFNEVSKNVLKNMGMEIHTYKNFEFNRKHIEVYVGWLGKTKIIGWSPYLQSAGVGGFKKIREFAEIVKGISDNHFKIN